MSRIASLGLLLVLAGCTTRSRTPLPPGADGGARDGGSADMFVPFADGGGDGAVTQPEQRSFRVSAAISWASAVPYATTHSFTLWAFNLDGGGAVPGLAGSGGRVANVSLTADAAEPGHFTASDVRVELGFTPPADLAPCIADGPIVYKNFDVRISPTGQITGTASGSLRSVRGSLTTMSDFTATLSGALETDAPRVLVAPMAGTYHPMDSFEVYLSEPLSALSTLRLTNGTTSLELSRASATATDSGPFMRAFLSPGKALPWGATLRLEAPGAVDLVGVPIDSSPAGVAGIAVVEDPGIFDMEAGFEAESPNILLTEGAEIVSYEDLELEGEGNLLFIPTGELAVGSAPVPTGRVGRATLRLPVEGANNVIRFRMALVRGGSSFPSFRGRVEGVLPASDRRVYVSDTPDFVLGGWNGTVSNFLEVTGFVGSRAASESELILDFLASTQACGSATPVKAVLIDDVHIE